GRQRLAVGRFLVGVGQRQVRRTGLQHVDQVLGEVLTDLHDREVRTQGGSFRPQRAGGLAQRGDRRTGRRVVQEVSSNGQLGEAKPGRVEVDALDGQGRFARLVEGQLELIAVEQVDAVEGSILGRGGDLVQNV